MRCHLRTLRPRAAASRRRCRSAGASTVQRPDLHAPPQHDPERHQRHRHDHQLLEPDARRAGQKDRQREPDHVEGEVQDDAGQESEVDVEEAESDRRDDELDGPRKRRLVRIRRVPGAKNDRLHDEADDEEEPALAESVADERGAGQRHGAEQRFFPEARLHRVGDRRQPRRVGREDVGMQQRLRRRPPSERPASSSDRARRRRRRRRRRAGTRRPFVPASAVELPGTFRPDAPELRMRAERAARQRFGGHERQREEHGKADRSCAASAAICWRGTSRAAAPCRRSSTAAGTR